MELDDRSPAIRFLIPGERAELIDRSGVVEGELACAHSGFEPVHQDRPSS
jgi:hypothetical protein